MSGIIRVISRVAAAAALFWAANAGAENKMAAQDELILISSAPFEVLAAYSDYSSRNLGHGLRLVKKQTASGKSRRAVPESSARKECRKLLKRMPREMRQRYGIRCEPNFELKALAVPNDTYFSYQQNAYEAINAMDAWDLNTGCSSVVVAVIDTGVDFTHPDLAANMWQNPGEVAGNGIDDDGNGYVDDIYGYDFANNDASPMDDNDHGTHCAGQIAAVGNNSRGVAGISWGAKIMALKFLTGTGSGYTSDAIEAINYAAANGAQIMSNSWGGYGSSSALKAAIEKASQAGVLFVAAAGNDSLDNDKAMNYPSSYPVANIVAVAAANNDGSPAWFSNYGKETVDLAAPGVSMLSTVPGGYTWMSGTSMATPVVSGAAALALCQNPALTVSQLKGLLMNTVTPVAKFEGLTVSGGMLDLAAVLKNAGDPPEAPIEKTPVSGQLDVYDSVTSTRTLYKGRALFLDYALGSAPESGVKLFLKVGSTSCSQYLKINDQSLSVALKSSIPAAMRESQVTMTIKDAATGDKIDSVKSPVRKLPGKKSSSGRLLSTAKTCSTILKNFKYR